MDRSDGLWFLMTLPLLPIAACTGGGATDSGTEDTSATETGTTSGTATTGASSTESTTSHPEGSTTTGTSTSSGELTTSSESADGESTTYSCETGDPCSPSEEVCVMFAERFESCDDGSATWAFDYCVHYVVDGGYGGDPCIEIADEYFACLSMLACDEDNSKCDQDTFANICGHA
jgi:hypothetical protein